MKAVKSINRPRASPAPTRGFCFWLERAIYSSQPEELRTRADHERPIFLVTFSVLLRMER
jgi:hypothetical protein